MGWTYDGRGEARPHIVLERGWGILRGQKAVDAVARFGGGNLPVATKRVMPDDGALVIFEAEDRHAYSVSRTGPIDANNHFACRVEQSTKHPLPDFRAAVEWATQICESLTIVR